MAPMRKSALFLVSLSICALVGCGSGTSKSDPAAEKKVADTKVVEKKVVDAKAADTKAADAKNPDAIHIDITHDKSGVLARAASIEKIDAGPAAIAFTPRGKVSASPGLEEKNGRLILKEAIEAPLERVARVLERVARFSARVGEWVLAP